jgi:hypothetical protein
MSQGCQLIIGEDAEHQKIFFDQDSWHSVMVCGKEGSARTVFLFDLLSRILKNSEDTACWCFGDNACDFGDNCSFSNGRVEISHGDSGVILMLKKAVGEMEKRIFLLEQDGSSTIFSYNEKRKATEDRMKPLILVFDDFRCLALELFSKNKKKGDWFLAEVTLLAQKGRAVGIHLIISMTKPGCRFIGPVLKGNILKTICFSTYSRVDSMTAVGIGDAHELFGDSFYLLDEASLRLCHAKEEKAKSTNSCSPDIYREIRKTVLTWDYATIFKIKTIFGLGFPRAGMIFSRLQEDGVIERRSVERGCRVIRREKLRTTNE